LTYVPVPVREEHVPQVIAYLAELERGGIKAGGSAEIEASAVRSQLDSNLVVRMYEESENRHRALMELLARRRGEWVYTAELAEALGLDTGTKGMAGVFGAFGRRANHRYGGAKPWEMAWDGVRGEAKYRMSLEVAEWIENGVG
jgi:hypothetical protein